MTVTVEPIHDPQVDEVAEFLQVHLNERVPAAAWAAAMRPRWSADAPNHGMALRGDDGTLVGAYLAFYSVRPGADGPQRVCNLGAWCVLPEQRSHSLRLLRALLRQKGWAFTDLSPSGAVVPLNDRLGFVRVDTTTSLLPNLPWPTLPPPLAGRIRLHTRPDAVRQLLTDAERAVLDDHAGSAAAHHVVLERGGRSCWVVYRRDRRKNLPLFASLLHVSDPDLFVAGLRRFSRHLLGRGVPVLLLEERLVGGRRPGWAIRRGAARPKMVKGMATEDLGDYLYSELAVVAW